MITEANKLNKVRLGKGCLVDEGVVLGYRSGRKGLTGILVIGAGARLRSGTIIYQSSVIGNHLETGHNVVVREQNRIGNNFAIWNNSTVDYGCKIGNNVKIHCNCYIAQFTTLEDDVFLAPGVSIANDFHPGCDFSKKCLRGPTVKKGAQIGVGSTLLPYVTIGEGALIGSGSVVTKDIPAHSVAYGNPARVAGSVFDLTCKFGFTDKPYREAVKAKRRK
ncbi:MAG: acyltransferase [Candidatus Omnitrophica bacterium]|nr:acyltransferase [Candidatus Omnitrophota bacterium]